MLGGPVPKAPDPAMPGVASGLKAFLADIAATLGWRRLTAGVLLLLSAALASSAT